MFDPIEADGDGNCLYRSVLLANREEVPVQDHKALWVQVAERVLAMYAGRMFDGLLELTYNAMRPQETKLSFEEYVEMMDKQYGTELDMVLISIAMNINVRCIFNESNGLKEHNSLLYIQHLAESLESATIKCDGFKDGICHDATSVWIYGHRFGHPMQPETWSKLNHLCALRPAAATELRTQSAYKGSVVGNFTLHIPSVQDKAVPAMISSPTKKDERHKSKRRRLTMEEQNAIRMALDQPNKQTHDAIAKQYGVARSTGGNETELEIELKLIILRSFHPN